MPIDDIMPDGTCPLSHKMSLFVDKKNDLYYCTSHESNMKECKFPRTYKKCEIYQESYRNSGLWKT